MKKTEEMKKENLGMRRKVGVQMNPDHQIDIMNHHQGQGDNIQNLIQTQVQNLGQREMMIEEGQDHHHHPGQGQDLETDLADQDQEVEEIDQKYSQLKDQ